MQPHRWPPTRLLCPWDSPGKNTGVGCHFLLQGKRKISTEVDIPTTSVNSLLLYPFSDCIFRYVGVIILIPHFNWTWMSFLLLFFILFYLFKFYSKSISGSIIGNLSFEFISSKDLREKSNDQLERYAEDIL